MTDSEVATETPEASTEGLWDSIVEGRKEKKTDDGHADTSTKETDETDSDEDAGEKSEGESEPEADARDGDTETNDSDSDEDTGPADPWESVPEELRNEHKAQADKLAKYEHEVRSNRSRVAALQKKVDSLVAKEETKPEPSKEPPVQALDAFFKNNEAWKKLEEDYEEVALPIKDAITAPFDLLRQRLEKAEKLLESFSEATQQQHQATELQLLNKEVPDWFDTISQNNEAFSEFVDDPSSPEELRNLRRAIVDANAKNIVKSKAVAWLVNDFKNHLTAKNPPAPKQEQRKPESKAQPAPAPLSPKREKQLSSAVSVPPRSAPSPGRRSESDLPDTDDRAALWNAIVEKREKVKAR